MYGCGVGVSVERVSGGGGGGGALTDLGLHPHIVSIRPFVI